MPLEINSLLLVFQRFLGVIGAKMLLNLSSIFNGPIAVLLARHCWDWSEACSRRELPDEDQLMLCCEGASLCNPGLAGAGNVLRNSNNYMADRINCNRCGS